MLEYFRQLLGPSKEETKLRELAAFYQKQSIARGEFLRRLAEGKMTLEQYRELHRS